MSKFYTHLLVKYPEGTTICVEQIEGLHVEVVQSNEQINFFCLSADYEVTESKYEKYREEFVKRLDSTGCYVSVLFDSISSLKHKEISNSIYGLEREFRNLIEIFMLKTRGMEWTEIAAFETIIKKDKKIDRESFVKLLKNPLDDLDFITLRNFVNDHICIDSNKTLINKLDILISKVEAYTEISSEGLDEISKNVQLIKDKVVSKKDIEICADRLYKHLNSRINDEWQRLYKIRNLWAHNNCIITSKEFEEYKNLEQKVLYELRAEMSMLLFFYDDSMEYQLIEDEKFKIRINRYKLWGIDNCKFRLIKSDTTQSIIIEKDLFTYMDLIEIAKKVSGDIDEVLVYQENPNLLIDYVKKEYESKIKGKALSEIEKIFDDINKDYKNTKYNIRYELEDACIMAGKVDKCLEEIFSNKKR